MASPQVRACGAAVVVVLLLFAAIWTNQSTPKSLTSIVVEAKKSIRDKLDNAQNQDDGYKHGDEHGDGDGEDCCELAFKEYVPSEWEQLWMENAEQWGKTEEAFCQQVRSESTRALHALAGIKEMMTKSTITLERTDENLAIFSRFIHEKRCPGKAPVEIESWIEPLAQGLRNLNTMCGEHGSLHRDYVLVGAQLLNKQDMSRHWYCKPNVYYFDLGASLYDQGPGGPSQSFFYEHYGSRGLSVDRALMWEITPYTGEQIFNPVPKEKLHTYQFFNIPAPHAENNPANPLNMVKAMARKGDYVAFKLDIDTPHVEKEFINQLKASPQLLQLIDEFYFEHHVKFPLLAKPGLWIQPNQILEGYLQDSYQLFSFLRHQGVRAHGWP